MWGPNAFDVCPLRGIVVQILKFPILFFLLGPKFCDIDICDPLKLFRIQILRSKNVWVVRVYNSEEISNTMVFEAED